MTEKKLTTDIKEYYISQKPIGLFALFNSMKEQNSFGYNNNLEGIIKIGLYVITDWNYFFKIAQRLKGSLEKAERWDIAIDATSFFLFLRIYYDSLASLIHSLYHLKNPSNSRKWPPSGSFEDQLKWLEKCSDPEFNKLKSYVIHLQFDIFFRQIRDLRNKFKESPHKIDSKRMVWPSRDDFINTGDLKKEIGVFLHKTISFTDFLGDYFLADLSEVEPIERMENDHHGYPRALMNEEEIETYKWFIS